jgi:hypothetical protein
VARHPSNVQRVRRPLTVRHLLRGVIFASGLIGGIVTAWLVVPRSDLLAFDLGLAQGAAAGALIGLCLAVMVRLPSTPQGPAKPRPSGFDALVAALDADAEVDGPTGLAGEADITTPAHRAEPAEPAGA